MKSIIEECTGLVYKIYANYDASHDFAHIERVMKNAEDIMKTELTYDEDVIRLAVLLHDVEDAKYKSKDTPSVVEILKSIGASNMLINKVVRCIESVSFSGGNEQQLTSIEGAILRDADRLDAIGAIGVARAFAFGGAKGRKLYDEKELIRTKMSEEEYRARGTASVTHFHEKLLLLKELMVTNEGKRLAEERHVFMVGFLKQLEKEIGL
ncbi:HD domain-containing protein [Sporosarcina sp. CAU 1771]